MTVCVYGSASDQRSIDKALCALKNCSYRSIQLSGYSDYDSFISGLGRDAPGLIIVTADGAVGMEGVIASKNLLSNTPVVWFSEDRDFGTQSYRLGCAYFHEKPISPEVLSLALDRCIG